MDEESVKGPGENIDAILQNMFRRRGFDFRDYKMSNLQRRISRRMDVLGIPSLAEYAEYLETDPDEYKSLFNSILVNTTQFFRDPESWSFVRRDVLSETLGKTDEIRIWSAGCASGEEPYSMAITLAEMLGEDLLRRRVRIYATDIDETALKFARSGTYTLDQLIGITEDIRSKYFTHHDDVYTIARNIRELLIFSRHDLILDPPMPRIDLLLCRNVLIYFNKALQSRIIPKLHYALSDNSYLWLGRSETLVTDIHELKLLNTEWRIFKKMPSADRQPPDNLNQADRYTKAELINTNRRLEQFIQNIKLGFVMLDEDFNVVMCSKIIRDVWSLLPEQVLGRPFFDLEISYRPVSLKNRIEQAVANGEPSVVENAEYWITQDKQIYLEMEIVPIASGAIIFVEDVTAQYELKRELQVTNNALETANEKLLSANEELANENRKLQAINEELQCTNEELAATNEELKATNEELNARIAELSNLKRYMKWL
ncbi:CheR family methyltransferase [Candidatus Poribacteria bacterium]